MKRLSILLISLIISQGCTKDEIITEFVPGIPVVKTISLQYPGLVGINSTSSYNYSNFNPFFDYLLFKDTPDTWFSPFVAKVDLDGNSIEDYVIVQSYHLDYNKGTIVVVQDGRKIYETTSPQIFTRKVTAGDLDNDGDLDIVLFGTGYDGAPWPGESVYALYFDKTEFITEKLIESNGYFHGGALGDINNDGKLDILGIDHVHNNSFILYNKGNRQFEHTVLLDRESLKKTHTCELFDINKDGYLDLFLGGHEWDNRTRYILGSKEGFLAENTTLLPQLDEYGVITDFDFIDINNDGNLEIIISRTGGSSNGENFYQNTRFQIVESNSLEVKNIIVPPAGFETWAFNTVIADVNGDSNFDIIPYYPYLNNSNWLGGSDPILQYSGIYFEYLDGFTFSEKYFKF